MKKAFLFLALFAGHLSYGVDAGDSVFVSPDDEALSRLYGELRSPEEKMRLLFLDYIKATQGQTNVFLVVYVERIDKRFHIVATSSEKGDVSLRFVQDLLKYYHNMTLARDYEIFLAKVHDLRGEAPTQTKHITEHIENTSPSLFGERTVALPFTVELEYCKNPRDTGSVRTYEQNGDTNDVKRTEGEKLLPYAETPLPAELHVRGQSVHTNEVNPEPPTPKP